jgi:hypothetical protein
MEDAHHVELSLSEKYPDVTFVGASPVQCYVRSGVGRSREPLSVAEYPETEPVASHAA